MNIYENCPELKNEQFLLRLIAQSDCDALWKVYSDKQALPFFNSDNCNGDNFYYATKERMQEALDFWVLAYENGWFVRLSIMDCVAEEVIGTIEVCLRVSEDAFDHMGILRVDVRSDYERADMLSSIFGLIAPHMEEMLGCKGVITKAPIYAVERMEAIQRAGFYKSEDWLLGHNGFAYDGYWVYDERKCGVFSTEGGDEDVVVNIEDVVERITQMEEYFDIIQETVRINPKLFREDAELQAMLKMLTEYYENGQWLEDFECDERGELPQGLKRGVLAEDGVYNLLCDIEFLISPSATNTNCSTEALV